MRDDGILADPLRQDVARAFQGFSRRTDTFLLADESSRQVVERHLAGLLVPQKLG